MFDPCLFPTTHVNKALQMDPHDSRVVTEYSAPQGSSGFSSGQWPGMDIARLLLALKQGTRSLEDYIQEYLNVAYYSDLPDCVLIDFFCEGINQPLKSRLTLEGPRSSLSDFMDYALLTVGSAFTVGVVEERNTALNCVITEHAPKIAATAEPVHKMAATTTPLHVIAASHESSQTTVDLHESSKVTIDLHELSQVTVDRRESSQVTVDRRESSQVTVDRRESSQVTVDRRESSQVTVDRRESSQVTVDRHESGHVSADLPESHHVSALQPESHHVSALQPESLHVSALQPESLHVSALQPESLHVSALQPESLHVSALQPESLHVSALQPESLHVLALPPEPLHVSALQPEPLHVSAELPEPLHVSAELPESITPRDLRSVLHIPCLVSSVRDAPLVSARAAGIPKSTHVNPPVPELIPLSEVLPMIGIALCYIWAAYTTTELPEVATSTVHSRGSG